MPSRFLAQTKSQQGLGEIAMSIGKIGLNSNKLAIVVDGVLVTPENHQQGTPVKPRRRERRIRLNCRIVGGEGFLKSIQSFQYESAVEKRGRIRRG